MKKRISLLILLFVTVLTMTSCSSKKDLSCTKKVEESTVNEVKTIKVELNNKKIKNYYIITTQKLDTKDKYKQSCKVLSDYYTKAKNEGTLTYKVNVKCSKINKKITITKKYNVSKLKKVEDIENTNIRTYTKDDFTFLKDEWKKNKKENNYKCK